MNTRTPISSNYHQDLTELGRLSVGFITRLAWSPNGQVLALAHGGGVALWGGGFGGAPTRTLEGHTGPVKDVTFSPDGQVIATASSDTTVRLWMLVTGRCVHIARRHGDSVNAVAFSRDGRMLASGGTGQSIWVLDVLESNGSAGLTGHEGEISSIVFCGDRLASGGWDNTVRLWNWAERREQTVVECGDWVRDLAASPDGKTLAAACKDGRIWLIDCGSGTVVGTIEAHEKGVDCAAFSPDGSLLVTGGRDNLVKLWDRTKIGGAPITTLKGHSKPVLSVAFHPAGTMLVSGSGDNTARLWGVGASVSQN